MNSTQIATRATALNSKEDLLLLLNDVKRSEMLERGRGATFYPFTHRHITYYINPNNSFRRFRSFDIKKKSGGVRTITTPQRRSYKQLLHCLNIILKSIYTPSDYAMGFAQGRSVVSNANVHIGQNYIFNIDLKNFFPSIDQARVWKRLQLKPFNFSVEVASAIAGMCAMRIESETQDSGEMYRYILPQGAATSPIITNMICDKLDRRLAGLAKRFGLKFTRYADDITFSSMHNVYNPNGEFQKELQRIIEEQGFAINHSKTRLQKRGAHQEVTGVVVSNKLNVTQKYVRDIRNTLYIWDRYGYMAAYVKFNSKYVVEKGYVKGSHPDMESIIRGKLLYLKMVKGDKDSVFKRLYSKFSTLAISRKIGATRYFETISLLDFQRRNNTNVYLSKIDVCEDGSSLTEEIEKIYIADGKPIFSATFELLGKTQSLKIDKSVKIDDPLDKLSISICRSSKGHIFWLLHLCGKVTKSVSSNEIDIKKLNLELDNLLNEAL